MFEELVDYLLTNWSESIVYFDESPFNKEDVLAINLIVPLVYEGYYTPYEINSSHVYRVTSLEKLMDQLNYYVVDYIDVTLQFVLKDGRCRYMTMCSHPQEWDVVDLEFFKVDLLDNINYK